jgi:hypothetical protein
VVPEVSADESRRRRNDEAVRRLREESRSRIARGRTAGMSHCMLGTMLSLLLFVALQSRRIYWAEAASAAAQLAPAHVPAAEVVMPSAEEVRVTPPSAFAGAVRDPKRRERCVVEYDLLSGEHFLNCAHGGESRAPRPACGGTHNGHKGY